MKSEIWKNVISDNLKNALLKEVDFLLSKEMNYLKTENKRLLEDNIFIRNQFKNLLKRFKKLEVKK